MALNVRLTVFLTRLDQLIFCGFKDRSAHAALEARCGARVVVGAEDKPKALFRVVGVKSVTTDDEEKDQLWKITIEVEAPSGVLLEADASLTVHETKPLRGGPRLRAVG